MTNVFLSRLKLKVMSKSWKIKCYNSLDYSVVYYGLDETLSLSYNQFFRLIGFEAVRVGENIYSIVYA